MRSTSGDGMGRTSADDALRGARDGRSRGPRSVRVTGWGAYAPDGVLTNQDFEQIVDTSDEWIVTRTGIRERHVAAPEESTASLGTVAARRALAVAGLDPEMIDLVIVTTVSPDHGTPATASFVKEGIGNLHAAAMDLSAACSGFVYGYATAHAWIASGMYRHVLVVSSEVLSRFADYTDRSMCVLLGDGAGAVVLSASDEPGGGLLGLELTCDPQAAYAIWLPAGGARSPASPSTLDRRGHYWRMDGRETYRHATRTMVASALRAVEQAGIAPSDVALFVPHQANQRIIDTVARMLELPDDRVFVNVDRYGNTSSASIPIALTEAISTGRVNVGDRIVLVGFGAGLTSGAAVVEWTADPALGARAAGADPHVHLPHPPDWELEDTLPPEVRRLVHPSTRPSQLLPTPPVAA